jgi:hypothetical protein
MFKAVWESSETKYDLQNLGPPYDARSRVGHDNTASLTAQLSVLGLESRRIWVRMG